MSAVIKEPPNEEQTVEVGSQGYAQSTVEVRSYKRQISVRAREAWMWKLTSQWW